MEDCHVNDVGAYKTYATSDSGSEAVRSCNVSCLPSDRVAKSLVKCKTVVCSESIATVGYDGNDISISSDIQFVPENISCPSEAEDELRSCNGTSYTRNEADTLYDTSGSSDKLCSTSVSVEELGNNTSVSINEVNESCCTSTIVPDLSSDSSTSLRIIDVGIGHNLSAQENSLIGMNYSTSTASEELCMNYMYGTSSAIEELFMDYSTSSAIEESPIDRSTSAANEVLGIHCSSSASNELLCIDCSTSAANEEELEIYNSTSITGDATGDTEYILIDWTDAEIESIVDSVIVPNTAKATDSEYINARPIDTYDSNIIFIADNFEDANAECDMIEYIFSSTTTDLEPSAISSSFTDFDNCGAVNNDISIGSEIVVNSDGVEDIIINNPSFYDEVLGVYRTESERLESVRSEVINTHSRAATQTDETSAVIPSKKLAATSAREPLYTIKDIMYKPKLIRFYTGLNTYQRFRDALLALGQSVYYLKYWRGSNGGLSVENQFFLTLIKLRCNKPDFDLAHMFQISSTSVQNIYVTWINYMYSHWKPVNLWTDKGDVDHYMPEEFRRDFPSTRVLIDIVRFPLKKCVNVVERYSVRRKRRTLKALIGVSPGGHISYVSSAYKESTADRQIIEESDLVNLCEKGDSIMSHRSFNVEDIFNSREVTMNVPYSKQVIDVYLKNKNKNLCKVLRNRYSLSAGRMRQERKLAEKLIVLEKTVKRLRGFSILKDPMNSTDCALASKIVFVCCMLHNIKNSIDS